MRFPDLVPQPLIRRSRPPLRLRGATLAATGATLLILLLRAA